MFKKMARNSVIHKWLLSYIFILIIPLIIFVGSMMKFLAVYENEIKYSNFLILEQARVKMDQVLYEANAFVAEISIEPIIGKLLTINNRNEVTSYDLYLATTILNRIFLTKNEQFEFLIYFPRPDIALSNNSYNNSDDFYNIYLSKDGLQKSMWDSIIHTKYTSPQFFPCEYVQPNGKINNRIIMVRPIMIAKHEGIYANIVVFLDESQFIEQEKELFERETFLIMDHEDKVLYQSENLNLDKDILNYSMLEAKSGSMDMNLTGEKVIVSHTSSNAADWKYVVITEEMSYLEQFEKTKNTMILSVILCCIIGGFMIFYLLRKNYTPLKKVMKSIEESAVRSTGNRMNEYQYIAQTINQLQSEKKSTNDIIMQQKNRLSSQIVLNLVENRDSELDLQTLERFDILFQSDLFLVLTFLIYDGEGPFPNDNEQIDDKEKHKMICLILQNIAEELLGEKDMKSYFFHTGRLIGFIINPPTAEKDVIFSNVTEKLEQIVNSINKYFLIRFVSACSDIHESWNNIPDAYSEALQVIEYNSMFSPDNVVFYHDLARLPKEGSFYYPEEMENHIINNLKIGNDVVVCDTIQKVINLNVEDNATPVTIRYLVVNIVGTIIKTVNQLEKKYMIPQLSFQTILQENSIAMMYSEIEKNVHTVCELVRKHHYEKDKPQGTTLYKQTVNLVKKHYADKSLNVGMIADELGVHVVHLSRTFMDYNGDSLSNYINIIRLGQAKKLILTGQKLETISEEVGFGSLRTFMRIFKKYEGITPGQFKETVNQ